MIELIIDVIAFLIAVGILAWVFLFSMKFIISTNKNKPRYKRMKKDLDNLERWLKKVYSYIFFILGMFINMFLATILAIGSKPIILKLNYPLGESYATFASYMVAVCLYIILPNVLDFKK